MAHKKLAQDQVARLKGLLHMEYTPGELADEVQCHRSYIEHAIANGCPSRQDGRGYWWIVGDEFAAWYREMISRQKRMLEQNEIFCLGCHAVVPLPEEYQVLPLSHNLKLERLQGKCIYCGTVVNRYRRIDEAQE